MSGSTVSERTEKNTRGIPHAPFVDDVDKYMDGQDDVEPVLRHFQEAMAKYRYMENNLTQRRVSLEEKIPDITKTLTMVEYLQSRREGKKPSSASGGSDPEDELEDDADETKKPMRTTFELNDTLYAEAELEETDTVYLWLGANVMLSYKIPAAIELLSTKLRLAHQNLTNTISDLEYIKEQVTIMEVNTARVYNWDVKRRREKREKEEAATSGKQS